MLGPKSVIYRANAALITTLLVAMTPVSSAFAAQSQYSSTVQFLTDKFVGGKALDGFTAGTPDYGFTIEAMLQRKAGGQKLTDQMSAIRATLADTTVSSKSITAIYLYDTDKKIRPGLAGKFLFASAALGVPNAPLRNAVVTDLKSAITTAGSLIGNVGNSFDYSWAAMGLAAVGQTKLANLVAIKLASLERPDGGFGMDQTGNAAVSSTDATGISLQALALCKRTASKTQLVVEQNALLTGSKYLRSTEVTANHWESFGDLDVNGTAYASMGLKAAGANVKAIQEWLKTRVAPAGGLTTPWSNGLGDVFATAQGYTALIGMSYLDLLPIKK